MSAHAAALAGLPGIGPVGLTKILERLSPVEAWQEVLSGRIQRPPARGTAATAGPTQGALFTERPGRRGSPILQAPAPQRSWADAARRVDPERWWAPYAAAGVKVTWPGRADYPAALVGDPQPPGVLFWTGRMESLSRLCVAIVGTRNATPDGRSIAFEMGRDLAAAGVCVVSGLALGIDGAAHAGALAAGRDGAGGCTVGIAASGVDVPYPRRHWRLWQEVAATGAVLSENLPGRPAQAWRFPARNRIIAGLVQMVVVVESHQCGGSLITAEAAIERGVDVRVVPGPVHSPASAGSNQLLYDGPGPVRHARDVLDALGIVQPDPAPSAPGAEPPRTRAQTRRATPAPPAPGPDSGPGALDATARRLLDALGWRPSSTGQVMARTGLDAATVARVLDRLSESGHASEEGGWWVRKR
ncbi:MAG TPA: DNA-processing protein DprA [Acidimicrobiales bacterium]|nr:DNA-processing protein DprA [Acidimicrobiales bacterium]